MARMNDLPLGAATAAVWIYWIIVGAMSWRVRRRTRRLAGVVPQQALERRLWLVWVPMVVLWMALPMIALHAHATPFAVPDWARVGPYAVIRGIAALVAVFIFSGAAGTIAIVIAVQSKSGR